MLKKLTTESSRGPTIAPQGPKGRFTSQVHSSILPMAQRWLQPQCPRTGEEMSKIQSIHTTEYYPALKRKDILTHAATWVNTEDALLSEISQL